MLNKKVILPSLALVSLGNAYIPQAQESVDLTKCVGSYSDQVNFLYMNCYDSQGNLVERYQRLFTRPLTQECRQVPRSSIVVPGGSHIVPVGPEVNNGTTNGTQGGNSTNTSAPSNGTEVSNGTDVSNGTSVSNGTEVSNGTQEVNTTIIPPTDEVVANGTDPRGLQAVNETDVPVLNATAPEVNVTAPVVNVTVPVVNGTDASNGTDVTNGTSSNNGTSTDNSTSNGTDGGVTTAVQVNCCDYYEQGAGYEFSVCDSNIGAVILPDRIGGERDRFYASQMPATFLGPIWTDLGNLVDNYCDSRMNQTANSTAPVDGGAMWRSLDLPWTQWRDDSLNTFADVALWLSRYTQYIGQAQAYLNENPQATLPAVPADYNPTNVDLSSVSYGQLVTEYQGAYQGFIEWYNLFFGVDGLVALNSREVLDGSVPVYEFSGNVTSFQDGEGAATFAVEAPNVMGELQYIAEWISTKFGSVILQNSCNLCASQNQGNNTNSTSGGNTTTPVVDNSTNSTNGTAPVDNTTTPVDNSTTPVDNSTAPAENSTLPVDNTTAPVDNTTAPVVVDTPAPVETTPGPQP